jgi:hypothetical protein
MNNDVIVKIVFNKEALEKFEETVDRLTMKLTRIKTLADETMAEQNVTDIDSDTSFIHTSCALDRKDIRK